MRRDRWVEHFTAASGLHSDDVAGIADRWRRNKPISEAEVALILAPVLERLLHADGRVNAQENAAAVEGLRELARSPERHTLQEDFEKLLRRDQILRTRDTSLSSAVRAKLDAGAPLTIDELDATHQWAAHQARRLAGEQQSELRDRIVERWCRFVGSRIFPINHPPIKNPEGLLNRMAQRARHELRTKRPREISLAPSTLIEITHRMGRYEPHAEAMAELAEEVQWIESGLERAEASADNEKLSKLTAAMEVLLRRLHGRDRSIWRGRNPERVQFLLEAAKGHLEGQPSELGEAVCFQLSSGTSGQRGKRGSLKTIERELHRTHRAMKVQPGTMRRTIRKIREAIVDAARTIVVALLGLRALLPRREKVGSLAQQYGSVALAPTLVAAICCVFFNARVPSLHDAATMTTDLASTARVLRTTGDVVELFGSENRAANSRAEVFADFDGLEVSSSAWSGAAGEKSSAAAGRGALGTAGASRSALSKTHASDSGDEAEGEAELEESAGGGAFEEPARTAASNSGAPSSADETRFGYGGTVTARDAAGWKVGTQSSLPFVGSGDGSERPDLKVETSSSRDRGRSSNTAWWEETAVFVTESQTSGAKSDSRAVTPRPTLPQPELGVKNGAFEDTPAGDGWVPPSVEVQEDGNTSLRLTHPASCSPDERSDSVSRVWLPNASGLAFELLVKVASTERSGVLLVHLSNVRLGDTQPLRAVPLRELDEGWVPIRSCVEREFIDGEYAFQEFEIQLRLRNHDCTSAEEIAVLVDDVRLIADDERCSNGDDDNFGPVDVGNESTDPLWNDTSAGRNRRAAR